MALTTIYVLEEVKDQTTASIFLAGPSPHTPHHPNWRSNALELLTRHGFNGNVFIPLSRDAQISQNVEGQIEWELTNLARASVIMFWIPRDLETLPGFTTNVEFGMYVDSGKIILGFPTGAPKTNYLEHLAQINKVPIYHTIEETVRRTLDFLEKI